MLKLGVNVDHVATLREARYRKTEGIGVPPEPDPVEAARLCLEAGAHSITAHLREDRRHIQDRDANKIREELNCVFNLEMAVTDEMVATALKLKPDEVCLVPESREEVTTEGGLNVVGHANTVESAIKKLSDAGILVSLFIDPDPEQIEAAFRCGAQCIELHTGAYANAPGGDKQTAKLEALKTAGAMAAKHGIQINAGHGLNYKNVGPIRNLPGLNTLNIGHSIISRSIFSGIQQAVREMLAAMQS